MSDRPISPAATHALQRWAARAGVPVGSLEEVLHAYITGARRPSEADAMLLVERHLGDPVHLSDQLGHAHGRITASFLRRATAAVVATSIAVILMRLVHFGWWWFGERSFGLLTVQDADVAWWIADVIVPLTLATLLLRWRRLERADRRPWYARWSGRDVTTMGIAVVTIHLALPVALSWVVEDQPFTNEMGRHATRASDVVRWAVVGGSAISYLSTAWLWATFIDPRASRTSIVRVGVVWSAFWCATASLFAGWTRLPTPDGRFSLPSWVIRPAILLQPWFETQLTWAAVVIGGLSVLAVRWAVQRTGSSLITARSGA